MSDELDDVFLRWDGDKQSLPGASVTKSALFFVLPLYHFQTFIMTAARAHVSCVNISSLASVKNAVDRLVEIMGFVLMRADLTSER